MEAQAQGGPPRIRVGEVIGETFTVYARNFGALIAAAFVLFVVVGVLTALLTGPARDELGWGELLLVLIAIALRVGAGALYTGFVVKLVDDARGGRHGASLGDLTAAAAPAVPALIGMAILLGIAVAVGLFLLVIPGLILLTIWSVTAPAIVIERRGAIESFGRSRELVRGNGWRVFWTIVVVFAIVAVITGIFGLIGDAIGGAGYGVAVSVAAFLTAPIHALAAAVIFFDLGGGRLS